MTKARYAADTYTRSEVAALLLATTPVGSINVFAGISAPTNWLMCYGQTLNAVTNPEYATLYSVIGNNFGGTGNTDFVIPDLRGRAIAGLDNMGGSDAGRISWQNIIGTVGPSSKTVDGGAETVTLNDTQIPSHRHWISAASVDDRNWTGSGGNTQDLGIVSDAGGYSVSDVNSAAGRFSAYNRGAASGPPNNGAAVDQSHNNMQPTILLNYIIKVA